MDAAAKKDKKKERSREATRQLDARIAHLLLQDATSTLGDIAEKLKEPEVTIKLRWLSLQRRKILVRSPRVLDWEAIGLPLRFRIDIQIDQKALLSKEGGGPVGAEKKIGTQEALSLFIQRELIQLLSKSNDGLAYLREQLFVEDVVILLGNPTADISAIVRAKTNLAALKFVTGGLRMMPAVARTSTYQEAWSCMVGE